jgi:threonine/homoserine/homoserine lactone efflux protein
MPDGAHLLAFLGAAVVLAAVPGPGMLYVLARTLGRGRGAGLRSAAGTALGGLCHVAGAAIGISALLMASATAFSVVRYAGAAYLLFLGARTLLELRAGSRDEIALETGREPRLLGQGLLTELLNPKTALFFLTFLPQFVAPGRGAVALQMLALGCVSVALNTGADLVVVALAGRLGRRLRERPRWQRRQRALSGATLITLGGYAAAGR